MFERLDWHEVLALHPELTHLSDGEQTHINHPQCPAGADRKRRLYIKRDGAVLLGKCHHCGQGGSWCLGRQSYIRRRKTHKSVQKLYLPRDFTTDPAECHVLANVWFNKYGITDEEREHYNLGWSEQWKRAILPIWQGGQLIAYQARRLLPGDEGPKYMTRRLESAGRPFFTGGWGEDLGFDTMVIVEDILSAIKVGRYVTTTAILTGAMSQEIVAGVLRYKPKRVVVWLDDDNPAIRQSQRRILRRIAPYADVHRVTGVGADPKELTGNQITMTLRGAR
jgi:hypothetical protein